MTKVGRRRHQQLRAISSAVAPLKPRQATRTAALALALAALAAPLATSAQQPVEVPRVGYLDSGSPPGIPPVTAFQEGLRELGYVEGQNITIEYRWADGRYDRLPGLSADLVRLNVKVIFAGG